MGVSHLGLGLNAFKKFRPTFAMGVMLHTICHVLPKHRSGTAFSETLHNISCLRK